MRLEEFLGHRRRDAVAPARRQRAQDRRRIEVALVVGGEDHRPVELVEVLEALDLERREDAAERQDPGRQAGAAQGARRRASGSRTGSRSARTSRDAAPAAGRAVERPRQRLEVRDGRRPPRTCASSTVTWSASSSAIISSTRSSELRPSSSSVVARFDGAPGREAREHRERTARVRCLRRRGCRRPCCPEQPVAQLAALQLARALGPRQLACRPHARRRGSSGDRRAARWRRGRSRRRRRLGSSTSDRLHPLRGRSRRPARRRPPTRARPAARSAPARRPPERRSALPA